MICVLCAANVPVGCAALGILLEERGKAEALETYKGDLLWSLLGSIYRIAGGNLQVPSYSEMLWLVDRKHTSGKREMTNDDVRKSLESTMRRLCCRKS